MFHRSPTRPASPAAVLLAVPGPPATRLATHVVDALALLSVPFAAAVDAVAVAVAALVVGAMTLVRVLMLPGTVQALLGASLVASAWAGALGLYETVTWVDVPAHLLVNGLIAAAIGIVLMRAGALSDPATRPGRAGVALTTTGVGAALAIVWEIAEWVGFTYIDDSLYVYYGDTIGDLAAGLAGSAVAGVWLARRAREER